MKIKAGISIAIVIFFLIAIPGCWDVHDINNMAFAVTIGIDKPLHPDAKYRVILEFAKPAYNKISPQSLIAVAEGDSIPQAIQRIQTGISRIISFTHLRSVIVGEKIAKERNFKDFSNYLLKDPEIALRLRLLFVWNNRAEALFHAKHRYGQLLASEVVSMGESQQYLSLVKTNYFYHFWINLKDNKGIGLGSRVLLRDGVIFREGAAVYQNWKLKTWLKTDEIEAASWLMSKTQEIVVAQDGIKSYTFKASKIKNKITSTFQGGRLGFLVKITADGMVIDETGGGRDFSKGANLKKTADLFGKVIKKQIRAAISKSQKEMQTDYLGFGANLQQHRPKLFKSMNWEKIYPTVPISVKVNCRVNFFGLRT